MNAASLAEIGDLNDVNEIKGDRQTERKKEKREAFEIGHRATKKKEREREGKSVSSLTIILRNTKYRPSTRGRKLQKKMIQYTILGSMPIRLQWR